MLIPSDAPSAVLALELIIIPPDRQRKEVVTDDLEFDLPRRGQLQNILVSDRGDGTYGLIAGERRLTAARRLGWTTLRATIVPDGLTLNELKIIELVENTKRKDLTWQDSLAAIMEIDRIFREEDPDWTQQQTADVLGLAKGHVSDMLAIGREAEKQPELLTKKTGREALNVLSRRNQRQMGAALEEIFQDMRDAMEPEDREAIDEVATQAQEQAQAREAAREEEILIADFLEWAPQYRGPKFNFIHCDFPYGVELFAKEFGQRGGDHAYADSPDVYFALLNCLLDNLDRLMTLNAHFVFWYSMKYDRETKDLFAQKAPSLDFSTHPFIWGKSDNNGIIGDARRDMRHIYEVALVAHRGGRQVVKSVGDFKAAPTDRTLHPSTKPVPVLNHLFEMIVDEHTEMLDPTCGSGSALRAADALGAKRILGLERDPLFAEPARQALRNARKLRQASTVAAL